MPEKNITTNSHSQKFSQHSNFEVGTYESVMKLKSHSKNIAQKQLMQLSNTTDVFYFIFTLLQFKAIY